MSCLAHVVEIELHPVLGWDLVMACPPVAVTTLEVLVVELKFKHSTQEDGAGVSALFHAFDIMIMVNPSDLLRRDSRARVQAEAVIPGLITLIVIFDTEAELEVLAQ